LSFQQPSRAGILQAIEVTVQDIAEHGFAGGGKPEQRHGRVQLPRVDAAKNLHRGPALQGSHCGGHLSQAGPKNVVPDEGPGLVHGGNGISAGGFAVAQACELGENEPHPVAPLHARPQLRQGVPIGPAGILGDHEAFKIVRVFHAR
jgi:hypothetical protein